MTSDLQNIQKKNTKCDEIKFHPYVLYRRNSEKISDFYQLTDISYDLTQQLLFKHPKDELPKIKLPKINRNDLSYHMGCLKTESVELICEWLSLSKYAEKANIPLNILQKEIKTGKYGKIVSDPVTGEEHIIWPPEKQSNDFPFLPELGKKKFSVKVSITAKAKAPIDLDPEDTSNFEGIQKQYLALAHAVGKPEEITKCSSELMNHSCFLLQWTIFEVFLKTTIQELIKQHPEKIVDRNKSGKPVLNYEQILEMSENFSSIEKLRGCLIQKEIDLMQSNGDSVHNLINYLKSAFQFKRDPYTAWYVIKGEKKTTRYLDLMEIKDVRNVLVHDSGIRSEEFSRKYPDVPNKDNQIIITDDYYQKIELIMNSIAFSIADSIESKKYTIDEISQ